MKTEPRFIERHAGRLSFGPGGERYLNKLSGAETGGAFLLTEIEIPPDAGPPLHRHTNEDESFVILEGELTFWLGGKTMRAAPGTVIFAPRDVPHTFKNCTSSPARAAVLVSPPGVERFFREFGAPLPGTDAPPPDDVMVERILKLAPTYGIEIIGPSPL
jgi:quercetin dioxygenase-like cupin family protein